MGKKRPFDSYQTYVDPKTGRRYSGVEMNFAADLDNLITDVMGFAGLFIILCIIFIPLQLMVDDSLVFPIGMLLFILILSVSFGLIPEEKIKESKTNNKNKIPHGLKKCPNCNVTIRQKAKICPRCGHKFRKPKKSKLYAKS